MRAPTSTIELIDLVRKSGIHPASQLDDRLRTFPNLPVDPTQTAAMLVKQGMLTKFQAKLLLTGRYRGFKLGSYVVNEQIGQGGMGAVYLAEHETLKRRVALKVLPPAKNDPNAKLNVERFLREARSVAALDHPNIVRIHDVGQQGEVHFLVMEYVEGQTLDDLLQKGGPITPSRAVEYIAQAAAGLQHAQEKGFIHRDIKPANLMLAKDGTVKILDMGLARSSSNETDKLTERMDEGAIVGTADFISPEQAMNMPNIDIRTDIYSLGATFFALVTGQPPFSGNTTQKLVQHQMKDAPSLTTIDKTFPPQLAKVVAKMLQKKPEKRYQSPGEVITAVAEWLPNAGAQRMVVSLSGTDLANSTEMQATLSEIATGGTARISKSKRLGTTGDIPWKLYGGVGVAVTAAIVLVCWMIFGGNPEPEKSFAGTPNGTGQVQAVNPNPNPNPPPNPAPRTNPPPNNNPPRTNVGTVVAQPAAATLYKFDPKVVPEFRGSIKNKNLTSGEWGQHPSGVFFHCWKEGSGGEFCRETIDGRPAVGLASREGEASAQYSFELTKELALDPMPGKEYHVRVEYMTRGGMIGHTAVKNVENNYMDVGSHKLPDTNGQWQTVTYPFVRPGTANLILVLDSSETQSAGMLYVRSLEILDPKPAPKDKELFRLSAADVPAYRAVKQGMDFIEGQNGRFPTGAYMHGHKKGTLSVVAREDVDGVPAFGMTHRNEVESAQIGLEFDDQGSGMRLPLRVGQNYRLRLTYKTTGTASGVTYFQEFGTWNQLKLLNLPPAPGWKTVEYEAVKTDKPFRAVIDLKGTGDGNALYVRDVTLIEVGSAAAPIATGWATAYKLDLSGQQLFSARGGAEGTGDPAEDIRFVQVAKDGAGSWPAGWRGSPWDTEGETAFFAAEKNGRMTLGVRHLRLTGKSPDRGTGMIFTPRMPFPAGPVTLRFTYSSDGAGESEAQVKFKPTKPVARAWEIPEFAKLPGTTGKPVTHEVVVDLRGATEGFFEFHSMLANPAQSFNLYEFELLQPGVAGAEKAAATPAPPKPAKNLTEAGAVQAFEFGSAKPFRCTFMDGMTDFDLGSVMPGGVGLNCWNKASVAEFRAEEVAGKTGIGMTNLNDTNSGQLHLYDLSGLAAGRPYRVKVEYLTKNDAVGKLFVRKPKENFQSFASADLPPTNGEWKTVTLDFTRPAAGIEVDAQFANPSVGEGNTLYVHKIEVVSLTEGTAPAPAVPVAPPVLTRTTPGTAVPDGPSVYAVDFKEKGPFAYTIENKKPSLETWKVLPAGVKGLAWKAESKAEFRGDTVNGRPAMGMTNLNDAISAQIQVDVGDKAGEKIAGGKKYRVKVDYLTANDAAGVVAVRTPKDKFNRLLQADLPGTGGEWKTATLDFTAPAGTPVDLVIENTTTGAGNTLHVAKVEVVEAK